MKKSLLVAATWYVPRAIEDPLDALQEILDEATAARPHKEGTEPPDFLVKYRDVTVPFHVRQSPDEILGNLNGALNNVARAGQEHNYDS